MRLFIRIAPIGALIATHLLTWPAHAANAWPDLSMPAAAAGGGEKDAVVIVAIEHYRKLPGKPGAAALAKSWHAYFTTTRKVPANRVTLLLDEQAQSHEVAAAADKARDSVMLGGRLWFLFIGHAFPEADRDDFRLLGWETSPNRESIYALGLSQMHLLRNSGKRSIFLVEASIEGRSTSVEPPREVIPSDKGGLIRQDTLFERLREANRDGDRLLFVADRAQTTCLLPSIGQPAFSYLLLGALRGWTDGSKAGVPRSERDANSSRGLEIINYVETALSAFAPCDQMPWPGYSFVLSEWEGKRRPSEAGPDLGAMALRDFEESLAVAVPTPQAPAPLAPDGLGTPIPEIRATAEAEAVAVGAERNGHVELPCRLDAVVTGPYLAAKAWQETAEAAPPGRYHDAALARSRQWLAYAKEVDEVRRLERAEHSRLGLVLRSPSIAQNKKESLVAAFAKRRGNDAAAKVVALAVTGEERVHFCSPYLTSAKGQEVVVSATDYESANVQVAVFVDGVEVGTGPGKFQLASCASKIRILDRATNESAVRSLSPGSDRGGIEVKMRKFSVEGDSVIDHEKKATWQRAVSPPLSKAAATRYCAELNAGAEGWRMPDLYDLEALHRLDPSTTTYSALGLQTPRTFWAVIPQGRSREGPVEQVEVPTTRPVRFEGQSTAPVRCVRNGTKIPKACDKETLARLKADEEQICNAVPGRSCDGSKVPGSLLVRYPCSEIHKRIDGAQQCQEMEKAIRVECFGGTPDEKKQASLRQLESELKACVELAAKNCSAGHPMADQ